MVIVCVTILLLPTWSSFWSFSGELGQGQMVEGLHVDVGVVCNLHLASAWTGVCVLGIAISAEIGS